MGRAPCCDKASVKKGPWSPEEDAKLKAYIEAHGTGGNWIALPQKIGLKRCGKSCRLRWLNYLRPNIRHGGFSAEEDQIILSLYISIGSRWSIIAAQLQGRTDNDIKNYWNTKLKKKLLGKRREQLPFLQSEETYSMMMSSPETGVSSQTLTAAALERMQLHMHLQEGLYSSNPSLYSNINTIDPAPWPMNEYLRGELLERNVQQEISNVGFQITKHAVPGNSASQSAQDHMECSALGFCSPSSIEMLVQEKDRQWAELDTFKEKYGDEKESLSWWSSDGFEESKAELELSSSDSGSLLNDCLMFQEYIVGYDL